LTRLIISGQVERPTEKYPAHEASLKKEEHYEVDEKARNVLCPMKALPKQNNC